MERVKNSTRIFSARALPTRGVKGKQGILGEIPPTSQLCRRGGVPARRGAEAQLDPERTA